MGYVIDSGYGMWLGPGVSFGAFYGWRRRFRANVAQIRSVLHGVVLWQVIVTSTGSAWVSSESRHIYDQAHCDNTE